MGRKPYKEPKRPKRIDSLDWQAVIAFEALAPELGAETAQRLTLWLIFLCFAEARDLLAAPGPWAAIEPGVEGTWARLRPSVGPWCRGDVSDAAANAAIVALTVRMGEPVDFAREPLSWFGSAECMVQGFAADKISSAVYTPQWLADKVVIRTLEPLVATIEAKHGGKAPASAFLELRICDPAVGGGVFLIGACDALAWVMGQAWMRDGDAPGGLTGVPLLRLARQLIAIHCLYAVEKNPIAAAVTRLVMWLHCEAKGLPLSWLDSNIKAGDSLCGLDWEQIRRFHWKRDAPVDPKWAALIDPLIEQAQREGVAMRKAEIARLSSMALSLAG